MEPSRLSCVCPSELELIEPVRPGMEVDAHTKMVTQQGWAADTSRDAGSVGCCGLPLQVVVEIEIHVAPQRPTQIETSIPSVECRIGLGRGSLQSGIAREARVQRTGPHP